MTICSNFPLCFSAYPSSIIKFFCLMNLHYSQTYVELYASVTVFHYFMDLHYSQTATTEHKPAHSFTTLWIYTILKQRAKMARCSCCFTTLWIYTILKPNRAQYCPCSVSLPYGFTLFSNRGYHYVVGKHCFTTLWIYTILKLQSRYALLKVCFTTFGFTLFSNGDLYLSNGEEFHYLMDLHYSQTYSSA